MLAARTEAAPTTQASHGAATLALAHLVRLTGNPPLPQNRAPDTTAQDGGSANHGASLAWSCFAAGAVTSRLRLGTLDTPVAGKPTAQIFVSEKAEWFDLNDEIPAYAERP